MMIQSSEDIFGEYIHPLNGLPIHVPPEIEPGVEKINKFSKVKVDTNSVNIGTGTTRIEPIHKSNPVTVEEQPEEMGNHLIYEHDLKFFQYFGVIMGVEMKFNWKPGIMFFVSLFLISIIISQIVYTTYLHIRNQNYYRILETLACYGITISMVLKVATFLKHFKAARALINSSINVCRLNDIGHRASKLRDRLLYNSRFYKLTTAVVMASISIFLAYPMKAFLVDHELVSLLPIEYMFVDSSTLSGFITANLISSVLGFVANVATAYSILMIVSTILNHSVYIDMFEEDVKYLDDMWNGVTDVPVSYRHAFMRNLCRKQQDMDGYVLEIKRVLDDYIYHYFIASYLGQIICLFQIVVSDWKSGYAIAYAMFLEMMFYCLMGTKISTENQRILSALQQSNWYMMDLYSQKLFSMLWTASTSASEMWIGPLAPLSVLTGTNIIKSIYSYYNILIEVA